MCMYHVNHRSSMEKCTFTYIILSFWWREPVWRLLSGWPTKIRHSCGTLYWKQLIVEILVYFQMVSGVWLSAYISCSKSITYDVHHTVSPESGWDTEESNPDIISLSLFLSLSYKPLMSRNTAQLMLWTIVNTSKSTRALTWHKTLSFHPLA